MYIEHLNLVVKNIDNALRFYQAAFPHWKIRGSGEDEWYGKARTWVHFGDDHYYLALSNNGEGDNRDLQGQQVGLAHFAFAITDIHGLVTRLVDAGFSDTLGNREFKRRSDDPYRLNTYFIDPDGYEVEFVEYLSELPSQRNTY